MSRLTIDLGTAGNPATGDSLRSAFTKVNTNFAELYSELGGDSLDAISFTNNTISTDITNANLILTGNGTGGVVIEDIEITGSTVNVLTTNNNLTLNTNGTGTVVINGLSFPTTDGTAGQVLKTDGSGNLSFTSAVPGSLTIVGDDSTGTAINIGETFKIAGTQNITTAVSGDTLTITGSKNIDVNEISSGDSSAIQINDAVNIQGGLTVNGNTFNFSNVGAFENTMYLVTAENNPNNSYWGFSASGGYGHFQFQGDIERMSGANLKIAQGGGALIDTANGRRLIIHAGDAGDFNYADLFLKGANVTVETNGVYPGRGTFTVDGIQIQSNTLSTNSSNQNLELDAAGSGTIELLTNTNVIGTLSADTLDVNEISSGDSSAIQINDAVNVSGAGTFHGSVRFNAGYTEKINALSSSSTITVNCATASIHTVTLAVSTGFVISNLPTGGTVTLIITQGGSGSYTATFGTDGSTTVKFPGGAPTLSTAVGAIDVVTIFNDGTNYLGNIAKAYAA